MSQWEMTAHPSGKDGGWGMPDLSPEAREVVKRVGRLLMQEASSIQYSVVTSPSDPTMFLLVSSAKRSDGSDVTTQTVMLSPEVWKSVRQSIDQAVAVMTAEAFLTGDGHA